jgi:hypothetical protein
VRKYFVGDLVVRTKYSEGMVGMVTDTLAPEGFMYEVKVLHSHNMGIEEGELQRWSKMYFKPWVSDTDRTPTWEV